MPIRIGSFCKNDSFEIPECNEVISNGTGLSNVRRFCGSKNPKAHKSLFSDDEWTQIISEIRATKFWIHNWNYPVVFTEVLNRHGLQLENVRGDFDPNHNITTGTEDQHKTWKDRLRESYIGNTVKRGTSVSQRREIRLCKRFS